MRLVRALGPRALRARSPQRSQRHLCSRAQTNGPQYAVHIRWLMKLFACSRLHEVVWMKLMSVIDLAPSVHVIELAALPDLNLERRSAATMAPSPLVSSSLTTPRQLGPTGA